MPRKRPRSKASRGGAPARPPTPDATRPRAARAFPSSLVRAAHVALFLIALGTVAGTRSLPMWLATAPERAAWTYRTSNGETYPYLSGMDSYSWVRKARSYLVTGSPCDAETPAGCRDLLRHAPVGSTMPYADSLHIRAIAWLHRFLALFDAERPIDASAFWLQVVVGTLGVVPAWLIGERLGGPWAGFLAAMAIGMHPAFFERSLGADNDVWNVVLPLYAAAAAFEALADRRRWGRYAWAGVAACFVSLHAAIWRGWTFGFVVLLAGMLASALVAAIRAWTSGHRAELVSATGPRLAVAATFFVCTLALTAPLDDGLVRMTGVGSSIPDASPRRDTRAAIIPDTFRDIGELQVLALDQVSRRLGGPLLLLGAVLGVAMLLVPRRHPGERQPREPDPTGAGVVMAVWLAAALYLALDATRWLLLAVAPVGLAYAGGAGRALALVRRRGRTPAVGWLTLAALATPVALCAYDGVGQARAALPKLNDAWWNSLREIDATAPPDAIVNATWPYGYWIEYVARRGATADGSSVRTRVPHWMGRALLASDPDRALGLLRMLDCGSDAWPEPEAERGAYERLRAAGAGGIVAYDLVLALAPLDRSEADRLLEDRGYPAGTRDAVLEATHCTPRPAYLIVSDTQPRQPGVRRQGTWDPRRAEVAYRLRALPEAEAVSRAVTELGLPEAEARSLYLSARKLRPDADVEEFVAQSPGYFTQWTRCRRENAALVCDADVRRRGTPVRVRFTYPVTAAPSERGTLRFGEEGQATERPPDALVVADATDVRDVADPRGQDVDGWAVLLDLPNARAMFGPPYLIRSLLTRLVWLGRPPRGFAKTADRAGAGERVTTWRIDWPAAR